MKTILIVIAGMADTPDPLSRRDTPLVTALTPSLDTLARRGEMLAFPSLDDSFDYSHKNALLSILGYDLQRGEPSIHELMEYGLTNNVDITGFKSLRPFVLPGFSGHGICATTSAWVRGVAKCAMIKPVDIYSPGSSDEDILDTVAHIAISAVPANEFVLIYADSPLKASLKGDFENKISALETIDRVLINPIADFVWKSELMINLAITTDLVTPWHTRQPVGIDVPAILYFNNHDAEGDPELNFSEVTALLMRRDFRHPSDLMRYLVNFSVAEEDEDSSENYPF